MVFSFSGMIGSAPELRSSESRPCPEPGDLQGPTLLAWYRYQRQDRKFSVFGIPDIVRGGVANVTTTLFDTPIISAEFTTERR